MARSRAGCSLKKTPCSLSIVPLEILAMLLYIRAIRDYPLSQTLPYLAFTPVFVTVTGYLLLGETLSGRGLLGILLVVAGAWLLLHQGCPVLYLGAKGRHLTTFPANLIDPDVRSAAFAALTRVPKLQRRGSLVIEKIDGQPVRDSIHHAEMLRCGFISDYRGLAAGGFA